MKTLRLTIILALFSLFWGLSVQAASNRFITAVDVRAQSAQFSIPLTFGQVFAENDIPSGYHVAAKNEAGQIVPVQVDIKATHNDGSLRFAVISARLDGNNAASRLALYSETGTINSAPDENSNIELQKLINSGFNSHVVVSIDGIPYTAALTADNLKSPIMQWLDGPVVSEWAFKVPFVAATGAEHSHLTARFHIRKYVGIDNVRVDVTVENTKAFAKNLSNVVYDAKIIVNNQIVFEKKALTHYHHARWRKVFWSNGTVDVDIKHDTVYLLASKSLPNYDMAQLPTEKGLADLYQNWRNSNTEPMGIGIVQPYMAMTGGRADIGPLPNWAVLYLLSMDKRAKEVALGIGELAGSYPIYYRDETTDYPVSIQQYPNISTLGAVISKPLLSKCTSSCQVPFTYDAAHTPSFAYVPYLVTGDYYFLETLHFLVNAILLDMNPAANYRGGGQGLIWRQQIRGQAWILRTLGRSVAFTPDQHPLKNYFQTILSNNIAEYSKSLIGDVYNQVHMVTRNYAFEYNNGLGMAPWQDDFFTWSIGHLVELGFDETHPSINARPLLEWKAKFPVSRMTDPEFCWLFASSYNLNARDNNKSVIGEPGYMFTTIGEFYRHSYPVELTSLSCNSQQMLDKSIELGIRDNFLNTMKGYPDSPLGYPANMQPGLAVSADSGIEHSAEAWRIFMSRDKKPDYRDFPVWNIVPRQPSAFITANDDIKMVNKFYRELLGREANSIEIDYWTGQLQSYCH